jgi:hypothetical protein
MTSRPVMAPIAALALSVALGSMLTAQPREFASVRALGRALVEYNDGTTHAVAAYYHSQLSHDSAWLLIEVGVASPRSLTVRRDQVDLVTPSGRVVPLASQKRWGQDSTRARTLLQQAITTRHQVRTYFREINGVDALRFFARPEEGGTVIDAVQSAPDQVLLGDLLFESPTGAWERGGYALNLRHDQGTASLPIDLK